MSEQLKSGYFTLVVDCRHVDYENIQKLLNIIEKVWHHYKLFINTEERFMLIG